MTPSASPRATAYAALAAIFLFAALAIRRPELAVVAAPFALLPALGLALARPPEVRVWLTLERPTALEEDELELELVVASERPVERLELLLVAPRRARSRLRRASALAAARLGGRADDHAAPALCAGGGTIGSATSELRARDRLGLLTWEGRFDRRTRLRVYPLPETLRGIIAPVSTQPFAGNQVARQKGEGLEFADLREFAAGDRVRSINWRASARRNVLVVNERHPERNADVILFLDTFADARAGGRSTLDLAVRATSTLATRYLERRDRVGLVSFGGILRWLTPGMGAGQRYRIVDALLESEIVFNYAWKDVSIIPARTLPPQALVVAITPLLDDRAVEALADLRARRYDLAIVEVSPAAFATPGDERVGPAGAPALAAAARGDPRSLRAARRRRGDAGATSSRSTASSRG